MTKDLTLQYKKVKCDGPTDGRTDGPTDRRTDGPTDRRTDRQSVHATKNRTRTHNERPMPKCSSRCPVFRML